LQVGGADRQGDAGAIAVDLVGCSGAQGGVEGDVTQVAFGRLGLDVPAALAFGAGLAAAAGAAAGETIEGGVEPTGLELGARAGLFASFPPGAILGGGREDLA